METILTLQDMPLCIGACDQPFNPSPLPSTYPISLCINKKIGRLEQVSNKKLDDLLTTAYSLGIEMGTPSDNTELGNPYVMDFVEFIGDCVEHKGRALEIGAGVGYLSKVLKERGWYVDSIEPGKGYADHWARHGVSVINEFFPSPLASGPYDLIVFYTVLEHIKDTDSFLKSVAEHLSPSGRVILSVPDCTLELNSGDPSMLLHEHYQYFTHLTLERTLRSASLDPIVKSSNFGRSIYACAIRNKLGCTFEVPEDEVSLLSKYGTAATNLRSRFQDNVQTLLSKGSFGIYCPGRVLNLLSPAQEVRFFDDSSSLHNKYYPPFKAKIESREELINNPPKYLCIMSRTFGLKLSEELRQFLPNTKILQLDDLLCDGNAITKLNFKRIADCKIGYEENIKTLNQNPEVYLTFDIDWACDEVLEDCIDLVEKANVAATWFVTHETPLLSRLRANPKFELGIHPNLNFLLDGNPKNGKTAEEVIDRIFSIVPEAKAVRCHSMTQNSRLTQMFVDKGLTHDCNHLIPEQSGIILKPWLLWNGLIKVPHFWEDDAVCIYKENNPVRELLSREGLKVFDFHPIHVYLNTEDLSRYEKTRPLQNNPVELIKYRYVGEGTRTALEFLLSLA